MKMAFAKVFAVASGAAISLLSFNALSIDLGLDKVVAPAAPSSLNVPWVNVRAFELDGFEPLKNSVEFQITTNQVTLDGGEPGGCCPVIGFGNLVQGEELRSISLTVNPGLLAVPNSELIVQWTGEPVVIYNDVFPDSGQKPLQIKVSSNPAATDFDITINYAAGTNVTHSKFLASYFVNGSPVELNDVDLAVVNSTGYSALGVVEYENGGFGVIGAVPEPGTYAMMGLGLLGLGFAVRRRQR